MCFIGTGLSYLVKYLVTKSYVPFITVFPNKFLDEVILLMISILMIVTILILRIVNYNIDGDLDKELLNMTNVLTTLSRAHWRGFTPAFMLKSNARELGNRIRCVTWQKQVYNLCVIELDTRNSSCTCIVSYGWCPEIA